MDPVEADILYLRSIMNRWDEKMNKKRLNGIKNIIRAVHNVAFRHKDVFLSPGGCPEMISEYRQPGCKKCGGGSTRYDSWSHNYLCSKGGWCENYSHKYRYTKKGWYSKFERRMFYYLLEKYDLESVYGDIKHKKYDLEQRLERIQFWEKITQLRPVKSNILSYL